ncbi:hypothetical protein P7K49_026130, partial [Saguinus oedipus]
MCEKAKALVGSVKLWVAESWVPTEASHSICGPSKQSIGSERRYSPEGGAALAKALRRHLPFLEALSQAPASDALTRARTVPDRPPAEVTLPLPPAAGVGCSSRVRVPGSVSSAVGSSRLHACVLGQRAACEQSFGVSGVLQSDTGSQSSHPHHEHWLPVQPPPP